MLIDLFLRTSWKYNKYLSSYLIRNQESYFVIIKFTQFINLESGIQLFEITRKKVYFQTRILRASLINHFTFNLRLIK